MPLFLSEEEYQRCRHDASLVAEKADSYIRELNRQLETVKAQADAASITAEQTCALLEQKYVSLSADFTKLESLNSQLSATLQQRISELAEAQSEKHQLNLKAIVKDGEIERLNLEASELRESNRQLLKLVENKDTEVAEKNSTIKSYLDKIVNFADAATQKEARVLDIEAELARCRASCARLSQEKELVEKHNVWLNEELTAKVNTLHELRRTHADFDAEISSKLADVERQLNESSSSLKWNKERVRELELKLQSVQEELCSAKETAAANEERFSAEISTVTKLRELYKESAEEWSKKAGELEGVIKALEAHLRQVEDDYKEKFEKERLERKETEKVASGLKEKLEKREIENENARKNFELRLLPISAFRSDLSGEETRLGVNEADDRSEDSLMLVPKLPIGVSGTALASSLLRDGWSLAKMYEKYQEAVDALRHEQLGRKHSQAILERVLYEIEEKAEVILGERAEHERMVEAYASMNHKLQQSLSEQANFEHTILELKADLRRQQRDYEVAQKDILDLQKQVTVLLKECRDIQLRYGAVTQVYPDESLTTHTAGLHDESDADKVISERLLTFKDINGLVEQNVQLRSLVRSLSDQHDQRDAELRGQFEMELKKHIDEATSKVAVVLDRSEEQGRMIESLHSSVAMYKRLYEEELKIRASDPHSIEAIPEGGRKDLMVLFEDSQEATKKVHEKAVERARSLEEDLARFRSEAVSLRLERDKLAMEANFARERLDSFMKEFEHQREEINGVLARNVEFSQLIVDYQRRLRENSDRVNSSEDLSRKLSIEVSVLKHEKEMLWSSEKRASDEVRSLSQRVHRLQATLDTIQSAEEVREEARAVERRKVEEHLKKVEREWAEAKKELQDERDHVRTLTLDREQTIKNAMKQVEEMRKELAEALHAVSSAQTRAAVSEARCSDLEAKVQSSEKTIVEKDSGDHSVYFTNEKAKEEMEKLKEEAQANKDHMLQYKEIAQVNEVALRQIESSHDEFKTEADKLKKTLEAEILSLRGRVSELESDVILASTKAASAVSGKEEALSSALEEISKLKEECSETGSQIAVFEIRISSLKEDLEKEHERWRTAQNNYERQVILQSETIQELTKTSQALALLQEEASELRKFADAQRSENEVIKATWESEKSLLLESRNEAERKYNEINEQNKILLNRLEALHIKLAEKDRSLAGISPGSTSLDQQAESDLQSVISYLRRSKEIAETEISLLKQEKLRLKSQLESALTDSERAQALLHAERATSRTVMFTDEEFKALQLQVTEVNLLRESNMQLREENKYNFEQCQKFHEIAQKAKVETEHLEGTIREKQVEVDAYRKEIEMLKEEIGHSETRITELHERYKNIDVEEFDRLKDDYQQILAKLREKEAEVEEMKKIVSEKQEYISNLEQLLANSRSELAEREKKINDILQVEATLRMNVEKQKKIVSHFKKKGETLTKEKDELSKEKQSISKQLEDARSLAKRPVVETASEQAMREKDTRIQILEKTLEREREELRKEKFRRLKTEKTVLDHVQMVLQEKKKLVEELERHKHARENLVESSGTSATQLPSETGLDDQTATYLLAVDNFEEAANSALNDGLGARPLPIESSSVLDTSALTTARQVPAQALITHPSMGPTASPPRPKTVEDSERKFSVTKLNTDARKPGRRLVRPRLEQPQEPKGDIEMLELEGPITEEGKFGASSQDPEPQSDIALTTQPSVRKRVASSSASELREESLTQQEIKSDLAPLLKKSRGSEPAQEATEEQLPLTFENSENLLAVEDLGDAGGDLGYISNEKEVVDAAKDGVDIVKGPTEELKEQLDGGGCVELQNESNTMTEEFLEKPGETEEVIDGSSEGAEVQDPEQSIADVENEREEGELEPNATELQEGSDASIMVMSPEPAEGLHEPIPGATASSDGTVFDASIATEVMSPEILTEEKNEAREITEEATEGLDKSLDGTDLGNTEIEQTKPRTVFGTGEESANIPADSTISKQGSPSPSHSKQGTKRVATETQGNDSAGRILDLKERAKQRSAIRQQGVMSPPVARGRGRAVGGPRVRGGRVVRGGRGGRGQPPTE